MLNASLIALAVGGATIFGGILGYFIKYRNERFEGAVFSFAAGIMLAASFNELILPVFQSEKGLLYWLCLAGLTCGGGLILLMQLALQKLYVLFPFPRIGSPQNTASSINGALLLIAAIAVHNLPEGLAAGVGAGTGDIMKALKIAAGIALQNIPEGMIVILPLVRAGVTRKKALLAAVLTGVIEIAGAFLGYCAVNAVTSLLPFMLTLAGGTMLYIICTEVLEDANAMAGKPLSGFSCLFGCCAMLLMEKCC